MGWISDINYWSICDKYDIDAHGPIYFFIDSREDCGCKIHGEYTKSIARVLNIRKDISDAREKTINTDGFCSKKHTNNEKKCSDVESVLFSHVVFASSSGASPGELVKVCLEEMTLHDPKESEKLRGELILLISQRDGSWLGEKDRRTLKDAWRTGVRLALGKDLPQTCAILSAPDFLVNNKYKVDDRKNMPKISGMSSASLTIALLAYELYSKKNENKKVEWIATGRVNGIFVNEVAEVGNKAAVIRDSLPSGCIFLVPEREGSAAKEVLNGHGEVREVGSLIDAIIASGLPHPLRHIAESLSKEVELPTNLASPLRQLSEEDLQPFSLYRYKSDKAGLCEDVNALLGVRGLVLLEGEALDGKTTLFTSLIRATPKRLDDEAGKAQLLVSISLNELAQAAAIDASLKSALLKLLKRHPQGAPLYEELFSQLTLLLDGWDQERSDYVSLFNKLLAQKEELSCFYSIIVSSRRFGAVDPDSASRFFLGEPPKEQLKSWLERQRPSIQDKNQERLVNIQSRFIRQLLFEVIKEGEDEGSLPQLLEVVLLKLLDHVIRNRDASLSASFSMIAPEDLLPALRLLALELGEESSIMRERVLEIFEAAMRSPAGKRCFRSDTTPAALLQLLTGDRGVLNQEAGVRRSYAFNNKLFFALLWAQQQEVDKRTPDAAIGSSPSNEALLYLSLLRTEHSPFIEALLQRHDHAKRDESYLGLALELLSAHHTPSPSQLWIDDADATAERLFTRWTADDDERQSIPWLEWPLGLRVLSQRYEVFGKDSPLHLSKLRCLCCLAIGHAELGDLDLAIKREIELQEILEPRLDKEHQANRKDEEAVQRAALLAASRHRSGVLKLRKGLHSEAERDLIEAVRRRDGALLEKHSRPLLASLIELSKSYERQGKYKEALYVLERCVNIIEIDKLAQDRYLLEALSLLGMVQHNQWLSDDSRKTFEKMIGLINSNNNEHYPDLGEPAFGPYLLHHHPELQTTVIDQLGLILKNWQAIPIYKMKSFIIFCIYGIDKIGDYHLYSHSQMDDLLKHGPTSLVSERVRLLQLRGQRSLTNDKLSHGEADLKKALEIARSSRVNPGELTTAAHLAKLDSFINQLNLSKKNELSGELSFEVVYKESIKILNSLKYIKKTIKDDVLIQEKHLLIHRERPDYEEALKPSLSSEQAADKLKHSLMTWSEDYKNHKLSYSHFLSLIDVGISYSSAKEREESCAKFLDEAICKLRELLELPEERSPADINLYKAISRRDAVQLLARAYESRAHLEESSSPLRGELLGHKRAIEMASSPGERAQAGADKHGDDLQAFQSSYSTARISLVAYSETSIVWKDDDAAVVIKAPLLSSKKQDDLSLLKLRYELESEILHRLKHRGLPSIEYFNSEPPYIKMKFFNGSPWVSEERLDCLILRLRSILEALSYVHDQKIIHSSIKPGHVLVLADELRLIGFGDARLLDGMEHRWLTYQYEPRRASTPAYESPEQLFEGKVSFASDIYSLGKLIYKLLTDEEQIMMDPGPYDILDKVSKKFLSDGIESNVASLRQLAAWLSGCLAFSPAERYADAAAAYKALNKLLPAPSAPCTPHPEDASMKPSPVEASAQTQHGFTLWLMSENFKPQEEEHDQEDVSELSDLLQRVGPVDTYLLNEAFRLNKLGSAKYLHLTKTNSLQQSAAGWRLQEQPGGADHALGERTERLRPRLWLQLSALTRSFSLGRWEEVLSKGEDLLKTEDDDSDEARYERTVCISLLMCLSSKELVNSKIFINEITSKHLVGFLNHNHYDISKYINIDGVIALCHVFSSSARSSTPLSQSSGHGLLVTEYSKLQNAIKFKNSKKNEESRAVIKEIDLLFGDDFILEIEKFGNPTCLYFANQIRNEARSQGYFVDTVLSANHSKKAFEEMRNLKVDAIGLNFKNSDDHVGLFYHQLRRIRASRSFDWFMGPFVSEYIFAQMGKDFNLFNSPRLYAIYKWELAQALSGRGKYREAIVFYGEAETAYCLVKDTYNAKLCSDKIEELKQKCEDSLK